MHKLFEKLAESIIVGYTIRIEASRSHDNRLYYLNAMKAEIAALKEAYGIVYMPSEASEQVFDINTAFALN